MSDNQALSVTVDSRQDEADEIERDPPSHAFHAEQNWNFDSSHSSSLLSKIRSIRQHATLLYVSILTTYQLYLLPSNQASIFIFFFFTWDVCQTLLWVIDLKLHVLFCFVF